MAVVGSNRSFNLDADIKEKCVHDLVHNIWEDEVESVAEAGSLISDYFLVPELVDCECQKNHCRAVHHMTHQFASL